MDNKLYHHLPDNTFRNPEGSPVRDDKIKWSYSTFNKEKKKLDMTIPEGHVLKKEDVLKKKRCCKKRKDVIKRKDLVKKEKMLYWL